LQLTPTAGTCPVDESTGTLLGWHHHRSPQSRSRLPGLLAAIGVRAGKTARTLSIRSRVFLSITFMITFMWSSEEDKAAERHEQVANGRR
jgi:hypothetical protein